MELRLDELDNAQLLTAATNIANLATQNATGMTPLTNYCTGIACLALIDLMDYDSTREAADIALKSLLESNAIFPGSETAVREMLRKKQPSGGENTATETANLGLRRLADLATATEEGNESISEPQIESEQATSVLLKHQELKDAVRDGCLNVLSREAAR
jgi:hypothetical protein